MRLAAAILCLVAAGCVQQPTQPAKARVAFLPDSAGLAVSGGAMRVDFGRAPSGVIAALTRELGPPDTLPLAGCPAGVTRRLAWGDLDIAFTPEQFVGWRRGAHSAGRACL